MDRTGWQSVNLDNNQENEADSCTHLRTSLLNCCRLPRNSPIICLLSPFLSRMNRAMPTGVSDTKPLSIRYWIPFSGFLRSRGHVVLLIFPFHLIYLLVLFVLLSPVQKCKLHLFPNQALLLLTLSIDPTYQ